PLAGVVFETRSSPTPGLLVGGTDRRPVRVVPSGVDLVTKSPLTGIPLPTAFGGACALASAETAPFEGDILPCDPETSSRPFPALDAKRFDAFAETQVIDARGGSTSAWAAREPTGKLHVHFGAAQMGIDGAGVELALGDLDQDGKVEVVTSNDAGED